MRGLRLLKPVKPSLYPRGPRRVKRTHIANQMKRVQGDKSPWRSLGRRLCRFRILPQRTPRGKHSKANAFTQKRTHAAPPTPFPVPSSLRPPSGSPQRNAQARSEPAMPDNHIANSRTHYRRSRPTAEQERNIPQAVSLFLTKEKRQA